MLKSFIIIFRCQLQIKCNYGMKLNNCQTWLINETEFFFKVFIFMDFLRLKKPKTRSITESNYSAFNHIETVSIIWSFISKIVVLLFRLLLKLLVIFTFLTILRLAFFKCLLLLCLIAFWEFWTQAFIQSIDCSFTFHA